MPDRATWLPLPMVGRSDELSIIRHGLDAAARGTCTAQIISGGYGLGKTRLLQAAVDEATERGFATARGTGYQTDANVPYALFADALTPLVRTLDASAVRLLARGAEAELAQVVPAMGSTLERRIADDTGDLTTRVRWHFAKFLDRLTKKEPLLLAVDNAHWVDPSSVALLQFVIRHIPDARLLVLMAYNHVEADANSPFRTMARSMAASTTTRQLTLAPLIEEDLSEALVKAFGIDPVPVRDFVALLHQRTLGNPFFVEETLKTLVERGRLRFVDDRWVGWDLEDFDLPATVREVVIARLERLSAAARGVADVASVFGARVRHELLGAACTLTAAEFVSAVEELRERHITSETEDDGDIVYDFTHPFLQRTIYEEMGAARRRELHGRVADVMEHVFGDRADNHATELAFHYIRMGASSLASKGLRYLVLAGRDALGKHADREAARYLQYALEVTDRDVAAMGDGDRTTVVELVEDLARARARTTEYDAAHALWLRARAMREAAGDDAGLARVERRLGLLTYLRGNVEQCLAHYDSSLALARRAGRDDLQARTLVAKGVALANLGRQDDAKRTVHEALAIVEAMGDVSLLARVERALLVLYTYTGPAKVALEFGRRALQHGEESGDLGVAWSAHWASAVLAGLTANGKVVAEHITEAERLARELNSPVLAANVAEVAIEYASAKGDWAEALSLAERTIPVARAVAARTLLPRILVWTGAMLLYRDEIERAKASFDEAWELSRAGAPDAAAGDVHAVIVAHIGQGLYYLTIRDWTRAIEYAQQGLAIADRHGFIVWAIHRLLAIVSEAALWSGDFPLALSAAARLREQSPRLEHPLGTAYAATMEAFAHYYQKRTPDAIPMLLKVADDAESIPFVFHAARLRRFVARILVVEGDPAGAARELRRAHDTFLRLGAVLELRLTREQMRRLGIRPPQRTVVQGGVLTEREREIARLVAQRKTNKEIARDLGISSRTVSTHLSNVFQKLGVDSRGELADVVREGE